MSDALAGASAKASTRHGHWLVERCKRSPGLHGLDVVVLAQET